MSGGARRGEEYTLLGISDYNFRIIQQEALMAHLFRVEFISNKRDGVVASRRAHNPKVPGSKPGLANFFF